MKKLIFDNDLVRIYDEGNKDIFGKKVYKRYPVINGIEIDLLKDNEEYKTGIFVYKANKKDRSLTIKKLGKNVGTEMFYDCPTANVIITKK
jgi:hypothetical protein